MLGAVPTISSAAVAIMILRISKSFHGCIVHSIHGYRSRSFRGSSRKSSRQHSVVIGSQVLQHHSIATMIDLPRVVPQHERFVVRGI
jgi:hypothetical protein